MKVSPTTVGAILWVYDPDTLADIRQPLITGVGGGAVNQGTPGTSPWLVINPSYIVAVENDGNGNPIYVGWAVPNTAKTSASWKIMKCTYSGTDLTDVQFASGVTTFNKIWNNRASYSYS